MTLTSLPATAVIQPDWPAPENIVALTTTRAGGISTKPYDTLNLAEHVGDSVEAVRSNRALLLQHCEGLQSIQWLNQVHGVDVVTAANRGTVTADASFTSTPRLAAAVMTADCLPVLICDNQGQQVAAAHAGWRGLLAGVLENTAACFTASASDLMVWFGPAISQAHFEVGIEVRQAFLSAASRAEVSQVDRAFIPSPQRKNFYFADIYTLAALRLQRLGITQIYGGQLCSYSDPARFYSYRRDGVTGRMASLIYKRF